MEFADSDTMYKTIFNTKTKTVFCHYVCSTLIRNTCLSCPQDIKLIQTFDLLFLLINVQNNLIFVSHKTLTRKLRCHSRYIVLRGKTTIAPGIVNCFNIVFSRSVVMKQNLFHLTNIILFVLLNLQTNESSSIH